MTSCSFLVSPHKQYHPSRHLCACAQVFIINTDMLFKQIFWYGGNTVYNNKTMLKNSSNCLRCLGVVSMNIITMKYYIKSITVIISWYCHSMILQVTSGFSPPSLFNFNVLCDCSVLCNALGKTEKLNHGKCWLWRACEAFECLLHMKCTWLCFHAVGLTVCCLS